MSIIACDHNDLLQGGVNMALYDYLLKRFGKNEPILINDIQYEDYSKPWLFKELKKLVTEKKLMRFGMGVYYIPTDTIFGKSLLNPRRVIEVKYLSNGTEVFGYYAGITLRNGTGLTTQMPNVLEVVTNNESAKVRDVFIGKQKIRTRRARIEITSKNVNSLQFLELMNSLDCTDLDDDQKLRLNRFIKDGKITLSGVVQYAPLFPAKAMKNIMESGAIYELA